LALSEKITQEVYEKSDEAARRRKAALELDILKGRLSVTEILRRQKKVSALIKSLGYDRHGASVCLFIAGRRICNLHPNYVQTKYASYLRNKIFVKEVYDKVATKITDLKKDVANETVSFVRRATTWNKTVVTVHEEVRKAAWTQVIADSLKDSKIAEFVKHFFELSGQKSVDLQKLDTAQTETVKKVLLKRFKRTTVRRISNVLKTDKFKVLQQQNKPVVSKPEEIPTRVTREVVRLPAEILKQKDEEIIALVTGRHIVEDLY
jgi:hypothetical protein